MKGCGALLSAWLFVFLLVFPPVVRAIEVRPLAVEDHFRHMMKDKFYTESWNYHFMTDTGELLSLSLALSNIGITSGSAGMQFTWIEPGSDPIVAKQDFDLKDFREDRQAGIISIGSCSMKAVEGLVRLTFSADAQADLMIHPWMSGFQVGDGTTAIGNSPDKFLRFFVEIPRGDFEGTVSLHGVSRRVKGAVYMEHMVGNILAPSYSKHWYSLRAFFPRHTAVFTEFQYLPAYGGGRWALGYVTGNDRVLGASTDYKLEPSGVSEDKGVKVPDRFAVEMSAGDIRLTGTYTSIGRYGCTPVFENLGWLKRTIAAAMVGEPIVCRFRSQASLFLQMPDERLHLEGPAYQGVVVMGK